MSRDFWLRARDVGQRSMGSMMAGRKRPAQESLESLSQEALSTSEEAKSTVKKKKTNSHDPQKFGGMSEEEVCKLQLPDHVAPGLDIIFVSSRIDW